MRDTISDVRCRGDWERRGVERRPRRLWSMDEKQRIVAETFEAGASVSITPDAMLSTPTCCPHGGASLACRPRSPRSVASGRQFERRALRFDAVAMEVIDERLCD